MRASLLGFLDDLLEPRHHVGGLGVAEHVRPHLHAQRRGLIDVGDDLEHLLQVRRRFQIPDKLCSARAHEIAFTAQRMIARKKIA